MNERIIIIHTHLSMGGRSRMVVDVIDLLNELGVTPTLFTYSVLDESKLVRSFGKRIRFRWVKARELGWNRFDTYANLFLNWQARSCLEDYDLAISFTNHLLFLPLDERCFHYLNFPAHAWSDVYGTNGVVDWLYWLPLRFIYRRMKLRQGARIFANSEFIKSVLLNTIAKGQGQVASTIRVLFPPVELDNYWCESPTESRRFAVCSLGRFSAGKRQLDQLKIAQDVPELDFHIIGQVTAGDSQAYFNECVDFLKRRNISNATLHPEMDYSDVIDLLQSSAFFLHTKRWEPFGMSTVEGIAAGCVPIVSNSGGQKEIVPFAALRFDSIEEAAQRLHRLAQQRDQLDSFRRRLQGYVHKFGIKRFRKEFLKAIELEPGTSRTSPSRKEPEL